MTAIIAALMKFGPWLLGLAAVLFGTLLRQQAATATAKADQKAAEAGKRAAENDAALAKANEAGLKAGADNAKVRRDEDAAADAEPDANRLLHSEWGK